MGNAKISGKEVTLFYDYDQTENGLLSTFAEDEKIEWFRLRMNMIFLEPLKQLFDLESLSYKELNSYPEREYPKRTFTIASLSIVLNGIESLGGFIEPKASNKGRFMAFLNSYMSNWQNNSLTLSEGRRIDMFSLLWKHFRNGITHGFVIENGSVNLYLERSYKVQNGIVELNPNIFFNDFLQACEIYFDDVKNNSEKRQSFLKRFKQVYPH